MATPAVSALNLVPVRADHTTEQALASMVALAQHTEALGYRRYWIAEHHNTTSLASSATSILISHTLQHTQRIRVGSGGVMLPNHSPLMVAEQYGTLATLYPERVDLGLGRAPGTDRLTAQALRRAERETSLDFPADVAALQRYLGDAAGQGYVKAFPGIGTHVPLYILGSSTESAYLAAEKGLPYVFAAHFAPRMLEEALAIYRSHFRPSPSLDKPYVMLGIPLVAAQTDARAEYLATTTYQRILALIRGQSMLMRPPVESMQGLWKPHEEQTVNEFLSMAMIGSAETIEQKMQVLLQHTQADELIFTCDLYEHADRLRSFEILAELQ